MPPPLLLGILKRSEQTPIQKFQSKISDYLKENNEISRKELAEELLVFYNTHLEKLNALNNEYKYTSSGRAYVFRYTDTSEQKDKFLKFMFFNNKNDKDKYTTELTYFKSITIPPNIVLTGPDGIDNVYAFIEDAYTSDASVYYEKVLEHSDKQQLLYNLEIKILELLNQLINLKYNCYDLKLENIFVDYNSDTLDITKIVIGDLDPDFCIKSTNDALYISQIKYALYRQTQELGKDTALFKNWFTGITSENKDPPENKDTSTITETKIQTSLQELKFESGVPSELMYRKKYLKYKQKYLMLKSKRNYVS
jgi:hypothetical protein